jgi:hypothetical protein
MTHTMCLQYVFSYDVANFGDVFVYGTSLRVLQQCELSDQLVNWSRRRGLL